MADDSIKSIRGSRNHKFNKVLEELALIHDRKGHDYGGDDPYAPTPFVTAPCKRAYTLASSRPRFTEDWVRNQ